MAGRRAAVIAALVVVAAGLGFAAAGATVPPGTGTAGGGAVPTGAVPVAPPGDGAGTSEPATVAPTAAAGEELVGLFAVTGGTCTSAGVPNGSWFRMVQPGGNTQTGPFVDNNDSPCADKSATPLRPGRDGGLVTRQHQPAPSPAFDSSGNGLADRILEPQKFYGVGFAGATNPTDPQTGTKVSAPVLYHDGGRLNGDLRAFGVAWNRQDFNQGAPKPDGSTPGQTKLASGTYSASTGAFVLEWSSQIEGGPFNGFTGVWHLEGTFRPSTVGAAGGGGGASGAVATGQAGAGASTGSAVIGSPSATGVAGTHPRTGAPVPWAAAIVVGAVVGGRALRRVRS